jgi:hypothetical protein
MSDEWKTIDVIGPECEINRLGQVRQKLSIKRGVVQHDTPRTPTVQNGRWSLSFREGDKQQHRAVHVLVARAFVPNPNGHKSVAFKDGDVLNVKAENLEWVPRRDVPFGCKLDADKASEIRRRLKAGERGNALAVEYGVSDETISRIKNGKTWAGV